MSLNATRWAWSQKIDPMAKLVLLSLADRANDAGECWPSIATICDDTGMSKSSVIRSIDGLDAINAITRRKTRRENNGYSNNVYTLQISPPSVTETQGACSTETQALVSQRDTNLPNIIYQRKIYEEGTFPDENDTGNGVNTEGTSPGGDAPAQKSTKQSKVKKERKPRRLYQHNIGRDEYPYVWETMGRIHDSLADHVAKGGTHNFALDKARNELTISPDHLDIMEANLSTLGCYADEGREYQFVLEKVLTLYNDRARKRKGLVNLAFLCGINMPWFDGEMDSDGYADWMVNFIDAG